MCHSTYLAAYTAALGNEQYEADLACGAVPWWASPDGFRRVYSLMSDVADRSADNLRALGVDVIALPPPSDVVYCLTAGDVWKCLAECAAPRNVPFFLGCPDPVARFAAMTDDAFGAVIAKVSLVLGCTRATAVNLPIWDFAAALEE